MPARWTRLHPGWMALLAALVAGAVFAPLLGASFVWDDAGVQEFQLPHFRTLGDAFTKTSGVRGLSWSYYRPLVWLSYMADRALSGGTTAAWLAHGGNLALHMGATALVFALALRLALSGPRPRAAAFTAALLFAVHPIHAESVASVAGRSDLLATLGVLGAALCALSWREAQAALARAGWAAGAAGCLLAGLLAKEAAAAGLVLIPLVLFFSDAASPGKKIAARDALLLAALLFAAAGGYAALRLAAGARTSDLGAQGWGPVIPQAFAALGYYAGKIVVPWPQRHFVGELPSLPVAAAILAAAGGAAGWLLWRARSATRRRTALCAGWFLAGVAPALLVLADPFAASPVAERYLYLPSVGFSLGAGFLAGGLPREGRAGTLFLAALALTLAAYGVSSLERAFVWRGNVSFWEAESRHADAARSSRILGNLANAYFEAGQAERALPVYRQSLAAALTPHDRATAASNLGIALKATALERLAQGRVDEALVRVDEAIEALGQAVFLTTHGPTHAAMGSALLLRAKGRAAEDPPAAREALMRAMRHLEIALRQNPGDVGAKVDLAECRMLLSSSP